MSDHVPCPLCGNGKLNEAPSPAAIDDAVRNHVTIPRASYEALMAAVKDGTALAKAEEAYRSYHDHCGDGAIETGRAWDVMRRRGERMRTSLAALEAAGIDVEEKT